jgi:hypothetical protein
MCLPANASKIFVCAIADLVALFVESGITRTHVITRFVLHKARFRALISIYRAFPKAHGIAVCFE